MTYLKFESLPPGVWPIKDYPSLGATLVECEHDESSRAFIETRYEDIEVVDLATGERTRQDWPVEVRPICRVCKATDLSRPVKMLAVVPTAEPQGSLF